SMFATLHDDDAAQTNATARERPDLSSAPTVEIPSSALPTSLYEEARPTAGPASRVAGAASASSTESGSTTRVILTTAIVTTLLLAIGGIGAWLFFRGAGDGRGRERSEAAQNSNSNSVLPAASPSASNAANESGAAQSNNQTRNTDRPDKGGRWFVILGSFQDSSNAKGRLEAMRSEGFDARIVSSNDYPNFKSGLWLVVMGPHTRNRAEELLEQVRPKIKDAYVKSGW
ncbi:MAG TPA: SPOR domain-containing protein, partial [Pyrinomonadaceae bacterium]|nr:SPOR domain-containing protein [Pyrinomonadaceae bacterium]